MIKKSLLTAFFWLVTFCWLAAPAQAAKHALLIGIADYSGTGFSSLDGTINDLELVRGMLRDKFKFSDSEIRLLKDAEATHTGIQKAFADLAGRVKKDEIVYIHFSGHGSLTPDLSGEKRASSLGGIAFDSTWVSSGSRPKETKGERDGAANLDDFDILDDEVGEWLVPIYAKTDNIVFVSDSCHSGNMTRGDAPKVRAIPVDLRPHPLGKRRFAHPKETGVIIGAAREDQQAGEYAAPDNKSYGLFSWNWVQALYQTLPGDTWDDAFKRTVALIGNMRATQQHPQIEGKGKRAVFGGEFPPPVPSISVSDVSEDGSEVTLKAGNFAGVTIGSTYQKKGGEGSFEITSVQSFSSEGTVTRGSFQKGDLAVEETHVYPYEPLKVFVRSDLPVDEPLAQKVRTAVSGIPGYQLASSQKTSDLMLMVLRPLRQGGEFVKARKEDTLPKADPAAKPEVWVLTPEELPTPEKMAMRPATDQRAVELVVDNLKKMSRIRELKRIGEPAGSGAPLVQLIVNRYAADSKCPGGLPACLEVPDKGKYRLVESLPSLQMQGKSFRRGDILTFRIKNDAPDDLYCYLIDIAANGKISAIFPGPQDSDSTVLVPSHSEQDFTAISGLEIEEPGEDTVKLIATQMHLDVGLFEQGSYKIRDRTKGSASPLESFLRSSMTNATRGGAFRMKQSQWGATSFTFEGN